MGTPNADRNSAGLEALAIAECSGVTGTQRYPTYTNQAFLIDGQPVTDVALPENSTVDLQFNWSLAGTDVEPCDFFVYNLPPELTGTPVAPFPVMHNGVTVGEGTVDGNGAVTIRFNNQISEVGTNLSGTVTYTVRLNVAYVEGENRIPIHLEDSATLWITLGPGLGPADHLFRKDGWTYGTTHVTWPDRGLFWRIHIPPFEMDLHNVVVQDVLVQDTWQFNCSSAYFPLAVTVNPPNQEVLDSLQFTCSPGNVTMTTPYLPAGTTVEFQMTGTVLEGFGPFTNTAILDADEIEPYITPIHTIDARGSATVDDEVIPELPSVTAGVCTDDVYTPPSVNPATTPGITYVLNPDPVPAEGGSFTVTASLEPGSTWATTGIPDGWVLDSDTNTFVFSGTVANNPCTTTPEPTVDPTVEPTVEPTIESTIAPTTEPTGVQSPPAESPEPTMEPTLAPTQPMVGTQTPTSASGAPSTSTTPPISPVTGLPSTGSGTYGSESALLLALGSAGVIAATGRRRWHTRG